MIPILYEKDETLFANNGLGRLRDCISCKVTEERNSIYECDFEYPMDAEDFGEVQVGRIIGVTHDDTGDIQPFDIVSFERPINGVVTFHAVHISYRQSYLTVSGTNINSLAAAFSLIKNNATPANPFTYDTDKTSAGYLAAGDGIPHTVRSMLGGMDGSILDAYGGEYEWNVWSVYLHKARGEQKTFAIRYGVNMVDYKEDYSTEGTYASCIPYWTDGTDKVVGDKQTTPEGTTITNRGECVPLDVSAKFENKPTKAQVNAEGLAQLNSSNPYLPAQTIDISFVNLQDLGYDDLANLYTCKLCDTIRVIFPTYNASGSYKIVKVVWDVLRDRYAEMELGQLATTLSQALGTSASPLSGGGSSGEYVDYTTPLINLSDYQTADTVDKTIYDLLVALGWSDCYG